MIDIAFDDDLTPELFPTRSAGQTLLERCKRLITGELWYAPGRGTVDAVRWIGASGAPPSAPQQIAVAIESDPAVQRAEVTIVSQSVEDIRLAVRVVPNTGFPVEFEVSIAELATQGLNA